MKRARRIGAAVMIGTALVIGAAAAASTAPQGGGVTEQSLLQAEKARFAAMQSADMAALEKLLGQELSYTHTSAAVQTKAEFISDIKTGTIKYLSIDSTEMKPHVYGNVGVITGGAAVHIILKGKDQSFRIRYTDVHVNRAGSWQMVAWESTRLPD